MKYIVIKEEKDIERAVKIITNRKCTDFEFGVRFKTPNDITFCNVFVHRIYDDYNKVVSGSPIDHYDILGGAAILNNIQGIYPNITQEDILELRLKTIYFNVKSKMDDPEFFKRWMQFHDHETGFATVTSRKKFKAKDNKIKSI